MTIRVLQGDCRVILPTLPANSVHTVVTSPPYYALRSYLDADHPDKHREIGSEATPDEYIATMVAVFREVHRVLREDGTCFVNLGDSYASGDKRPSQFPSPERALACDNGGTEPLGSQASDYACRDLCDGCLAALSSRNGGSYQQPPQSRQPELPIGRDSAHPGSVPAFASAGLHVVPASTTPVSSSRPSGLCSHCANCGACLSVLRSSSRDARECVRSSWLNIPKFSHKPKDLMMMPARLALALQQDGWWIRSEIVWAKPNPMPESVTDRPTSAHEKVYLLTKRSSYFYDADAVREPATTSAEEWETKSANWRNGEAKQQQRGPTYHPYKDAKPFENGPNPLGRNLRNVWNVATEPFSGSHFATMPTEIVARCIKAGTSERGCCAQCGKPWVRQTERQRTRDGEPLTGGWNTADGYKIGASGVGHWRDMTQTTTTGWLPACQCGPLRCVNCGASEPPGCGPYCMTTTEPRTKPCTVLDPFAGAGTTGLVADRLQRDAVLIELSPDYVSLMKTRIEREAGLFSNVVESSVGSDRLPSIPPLSGTSDITLLDLIERATLNTAKV